MLDLIHWHSLNPKPLGPTSVVVDLGANIGQFAQAIHDKFGCTVIAVEPNPHLFKHLSKRSGIKAIHAAIVENNGPVNLMLDENHLASRIVETEPNTVVVEGLSLDTLFEKLGVSHIDLLKVDIEGAEFPMILKTSDGVLKRIHQITIELHDFCGLLSPEKVTTLLTRMRTLGFHVSKMSRIGHQDTWMSNESFQKIRATDRVAITLLKYLRGGRRLVRKMYLGKEWHIGY
ncbi:MAG: FkbM family methyltransferase [bacterium]